LIKFFSAAAARFRKKKKHLEHILINKVHELEDKVKELQSENKRITIQMHFYRNESANAKDLLLAHRDCSVTRQLTKCKFTKLAISQYIYFFSFS